MWNAVRMTPKSAMPSADASLQMTARSPQQSASDVPPQGCCLCGSAAVFTTRHDGALCSRHALMVIACEDDWAALLRGRPTGATTASTGAEPVT
jgi:hypothetical protein